MLSADLKKIAVGDKIQPNYHGGHFSVIAEVEDRVPKASSYFAVLGNRDTESFTLNNPPRAF